MQTQTLITAAILLAALAYATRFGGIGSHQKGRVSGRYIHLDNGLFRQWTY